MTKRKHTFWRKHSLAAIALLSGLGLAGLAGVGFADEAADVKPTVEASNIAASAKEVHPLQPPAAAPAATLKTADNKPADLAELYKAGNSVLIFYRGGWCPYCNTHLGQIAQAEPELKAMGFQVLAISPDKPEALQATLDKGGYTYLLLSDAGMTLSRAFGLAFRVDDETVGKYRGYGIDLAQIDGGDYTLPVPAVYIVDTDGKIRFAHSDPDYTKRLSPADLLAAAKDVAGR